MATETILNMEGARIKFGAGATREWASSCAPSACGARSWLPIR